ncbi:hypothetical protein SAMN05421810_10169 [Amycolatopsis arida]|uniref:Minor tail protein n=1 Tax=Amycolatopsis arida TaxID=587909 RepID=A0A1I5KAU7_9PSEU|nr:hypothetical protein [Amycolatopsis arida]TDX96965.1 hypothetical protein CLV69_10267 [Amycolatopsis arida]SFO82145.1 hypothetical protein SAMN05421810_10169 [Amycolatopsis arida]
MDSWRVLVADTISGSLLADITPRDLPSFTRKITDRGQWTVNVVPDDRANASLDLHSLTDVGRSTWAIVYGTVVVQAGPTWTHSYDETTRTLSVSGTGIQGLFDRRVLRAPVPYTSIVNPSEDVIISGRSLRGIAREIVATNLAQSGYGLPIDLPAPETGTHTRTYQGYDLAMVWDRLDDLSKVINGPEVDFMPYLVPGQNRLRWHMLTGSPLLGDQQTAAVWDYGGALSAIDLDSNGAASPCTRVWVRGSGTERGLLVGYATDPTLIGLGFPPTDYVNGDHTSVTEQKTLDDYAVAALTQFSAPTETWRCSIRIDGATAAGVEVSPALGAWSLGDAPTFGVSGHPWIPDGQYRRRILGFRDNDETSVQLDLEPTPAAL